jgi:hypothetical protein
MSKYDDELAEMKTTDLLGYFADPRAVAARFPPPTLMEGAPLEEWQAVATEYLVAVGAEIDLRIPPRKKQAATAPFPGFFGKVP